MIGPTLLGQRYGMDGAICSNAAHVDVVAGSKRAIVITITDGLAPPFYAQPHRHADNIKQMRATRRRRSSGSSPIRRPTSSLLDSQAGSPALHSGYERAKTEAPKIKAFMGLVEPLRRLAR